MRPSKPLCGLGGGEVFTLFALGFVCLTLPPTRFFLLSWSSPIAFCGLACPVTHLLSPRPLLCERPLGIDYYLQVAILTPEGNNPPSTGKVAHTTGVYIQYPFQCKAGVDSFRSHKYHCRCRTYETYGFSSLSEKTTKSNCFQMSLRRQLTFFLVI